LTDSTYGVFNRGGCTKVAWLEVFDVLDLSSLAVDVDLDTDDLDTQEAVLDRGLSPPSLDGTGVSGSACHFAVAGVSSFLRSPFLCSVDKSVSGGVSGRSSFRVSFRGLGDVLLLVGESADFVLRIVALPRSVGIGVRGSVPRPGVADTSSLPAIYSLLCALLKLG
jgi:hypothetical protein